MEVIPSIDLYDGKVVRLVHGDPRQLLVYNSDPLATAEKWITRGATRLHIVDIDAALGKGTNSAMVQSISKMVKIPVQVGGGIRNISRVSDLIKIGVDRVIIGTLAFKDRKATRALLTKFGPERITIALDYSSENVMIEGWKSKSGMRVFDCLELFVSFGFGRFLMTDISRDGALTGPNLETLSRACEIHGAKIGASGGIRSIKDIESVRTSGAESVIVGRALYENKLDLEAAIEITA